MGCKEAGKAIFWGGGADGKGKGGVGGWDLGVSFLGLVPIKTDVILQEEYKILY